MSLEQAHHYLGWPSPEDVRNPPGIGPKVIAQLAKEKIGNALSRLPDGDGVNVGVLAADADATEAPLAIVCEFPRSVSSETLHAAHRLAWNFCRSSLLITVEPHLIRKWTCCEPPADQSSTLFSDNQPEIGPPITFEHHSQSLAQQAAASLQWINLVSGQLFKEQEARFKPERRADRLLLENLRCARQRLMALKLDEDTTHDLLARIIFVQFLFDRKDASGVAALNPNQLNRLYIEGILSAQYSNLAGILNNYEDTYRLFRFLNTTFNGDLFPGKGATTQEQEAEWKAERDRVKPKHLNLLARFISGKEKMQNGQLILWKQYSFDAIPIEFISSIYEEFVKKLNTPGVHYTPPYLVDFMLDGVLPWDSVDWDLKVLDPACGSGVFLVKAYQRLIHRWKNAHMRLPEPDVLTHLLEHNLFGIDKDREAVRVASFSLYLAMCDEISPRDYWTKVHFPLLRGRRLVASDFFNEQVEGIQTGKDTHYDLVVGNAPWGKNLLTDAAHQWARDNRWEIANKQIGTLFLAKSLALAKEQSGQVCMVQPAGAVLFNRSPTAKTFRTKLFENFKVDEIVNLSALRFQLFPNAVGPACTISVQNTPPIEDDLLYMCPKAINMADDYRVAIEPHDIQWVNPVEALENDYVWTSLIWGGSRDLGLLRHLGGCITIAKLKKIGDKAQKIVFAREGIVWGDERRASPEILGRRILDEDDFPSGEFFRFDSDQLPSNKRGFTHSETSFRLTAFEAPQILIKQSWQASSGRFQARLVNSEDDTHGVLCNQSYVSVSTKQENKFVLDAACLSYNSIVTVYYLLLTSSRFAPYRPEVLVGELLNVPLPTPSPNLLDGVDSYTALDQRAQQAFGLKEAEWTLIEDLNKFTLPDFKGDETSPGRQPTRPLNAQSAREETALTQYCDYFTRVIKAGFGQNKNVCATIYQEEDSRRPLPLRLVAFHFDWPGRALIQTESMSTSDLYARLQSIYQNVLKQPDKSKLYYQRTIRVYDTVDTPQGKVPTVYLIKPDQTRYWTRSMGMRDADDVTVDIMISDNQDQDASSLEKIA